MEVPPVPTAPEWEQASTPEGLAGLTADGVPPRLATLLARRGVSSASEAAEFLNPDVSALHDPHRLSGMQEAIQRLLEARDQHQKVAIVGDYDVDGVSATALLVAVLEASGLEVMPILPERLKEGYGFQPVHVESAAESGCKLVVTADCGSTALAAASAAGEAGMGVIVTDHHLGSEVQLPGWVIEINPHATDSDYPFPDLSGAGVAFKLAMALLDAVGHKVDIDALLRVTCLGTICDLVPLRGENRVIASRGLASLMETRSVGLRALMRKASVTPPVTAADVGFRIGPRINAAGRLASPRPALELLLTTDRTVAEQLAENLETWNRERRGTESGVVEEAESRFRDLEILPPVLVGWSADWHPGVLGIAAGRISRTFYRPTILFHVGDDIAKGSGRSVPGIHLFDFLGQWRDRYERFGGHSQAVGLSVLTDSLDSLSQTWQAEATVSWSEELLTKTLEYELVLSAEDVDSDLLTELTSMEPFGMGNRQPVLRVSDLQLAATPRRFGRGHLTAKAVGREGGQVDLLGWGWQEREGDLMGSFEILCTLDRDRYHGGPVLRLLDARPAEGSSSAV